MQTMQDIITIRILLGLSSTLISMIVSPSYEIHTGIKVAKRSSSCHMPNLVGVDRPKIFKRKEKREYKKEK